MDYEEEQRRRLWEQRLSSAAPPITQAVRRAIIDRTLEPSGCGAAVAAWYKRQLDVPVLILAGTIGRGKTVAAASLIARDGGAYVAADTLVKLGSNSYSAVAEQYRKLADSTPLVIDDVGREESGGRLGSILLDLLDGRRAGRHWTLIITNLTRAQFEARFADPRLASRLRESARWVSDFGPDLREAPARENVR